LAQTGTLNVVIDIRLTCAVEVSVKREAQPINAVGADASPLALHSSTAPRYRFKKSDEERGY